MGNWMIKITLDYDGNGCVSEGYVAYDEQMSRKRPCVLICHAWGGQGEPERRRAELIAELGYVGFAIDLYGKGKRGNLYRGNAHLMQPFIDDRKMLRQRLIAAVKTAQNLAQVDANRIAVIGWGFGGLCALDLARSALDGVKGVVSYYGPFDPPNLPQSKITTKILIHQGYEDPIVHSSKIPNIADELTKAGADWRIQIYGNAKHAFNSRSANLPEEGILYNPEAAQRSEDLTENFLKEVLC
jgi:dienelactone hydrolase